MPNYQVKNWERFQHYKDRSPPWIRLYKGLLDDYEFHCLPDASRALAPMMWLLASENNDPNSGMIAGPDERIAFRLRMTVGDFRRAIKPLCDNGFIGCSQDDSVPITSCHRDALPEAETETEMEKEKERSARKRKLSLEELAVEHNSEWLSNQRAKGRYIHHDEHFILDQFKQYCEAKGKKYEDYLAGYRNAFEWEKCQPKTGGTPVTKADRAKAAVMRAAVSGGFAPEGGFQQ